VVRSRDTHAWPELYFAGIGWVRFEPTPAGPGGQGTATVPQYAIPAAAAAPGLPTTAPGPNSVAPAPSSSGSPGASVQRPRDPDNITTPTGLSGSTGTHIPYGLIVGVAVALLILLTPMATRLLIRRRRWRQVDGADAAGARAAHAARAAWAELRADAIDYGVEWRPAESPRAVARRLARQLNLGGAAADALTRITMAEERARYAPSPGQTETLRADSRLMRKTFAGAGNRRTRVRARLFPSSTMAAYRTALSRLLDMLDRFENLAFAGRWRWRARRTSAR